MTVVHILAFRFKEDSSPDKIKELLAQLVALKDISLHPISNKPLILSAVTGKNHGIVPNRYGFSHAARLEFATVEGCRYFVEKDPGHLNLALAFVQLTEDILVMDFTSGEL